MEDAQGNAVTEEELETDGEGVEGLKLLDEQGLDIAIIGVGGCGSNILADIYKDFQRREISENLTWAAINTDTQALNLLVRKKGFPANAIFQVGERLTNGRGAGSDPEKGETAALEDLPVLRELVEGKDLVIVIAGLGGGSGSGITPVLLKEANEAGALTLTWCVMPYENEGVERTKIAYRAITAICKESDAYVQLENDKARGVLMSDIMDDINNTMSEGMEIILEALTQPADFNIDFADLRKVLENGGRVLFSVAKYDGAQRDQKILKELARFSLQKGSTKKILRAILFIKGGSDMRKDEIQTVNAGMCKKLATADGLAIMGVRVEDKKQGLEALFLGVLGK